MKNVCLLLTKYDGFPWNVRMPAMDVFEASGYNFSEVRWMPLREPEDLENAIVDCKNAADNVVVLVDGFSLASVATVALLAFGLDESPSSVNGEGVFSVGEKSLLLMDG